eukprot:TRINITY_DN23610_c0_g1_i1.p1 TRINITY_DN23610_c0_g1~~TRINITY_DN23610_c0_g1_i1.p1  ORF type:complete len:163 (+),score=16.70 TRINITY_DN23610_c0_g1_i1:45-491(+)
MATLCMPLTWATFHGAAGISTNTFRASRTSAVKLGQRSRADVAWSGKALTHQRARATGGTGGEPDKPLGTTLEDAAKESETEAEAVQYDERWGALEGALGRAFGTPLWFGVLLAALALFGGIYVYCIYSFADFSNIPILNGPQGAKPQ